MRETERQINIYKEKLPRMKERVGAALVMLLLAVVMTVSSSMAWLVLSSDPEVKGMNTTITANGNLEIALASGTTITPPKDTAIGDGSLPLVERNITWGNLVNLGDSAYGLENIVLRPAQLNRNSLLESPLYAAGYGSDGRVDQLDSDFAYAYYDPDSETFSADETRYGVRTIASVTYTDKGQNVELASRVAVANAAIGAAQSHLQNNVAASPKIAQLGSVMGAFIQSKLDDKTAVLTEEQVSDIYDLMTYLQENMEMSADALAAVYNVRMLRYGGSEYVRENEFTGEFLLTATDSELNAKLAQKNTQGQVIVSPTLKAKLTTLRSDYKTLSSNVATMQTYLGRNDIVIQDLDGQGRPEIRNFVDNIAHITSTRVGGENGTAIGSLSIDNISSFMGSTASEPKDVVVTQGILQRLDIFTGTGAKTNLLTIKAKYLVTITVYGVVRTNAPSDSNFGVLSRELKAALEGESSYKGSDPVAGDTFGMALDFFLRTNASNSHLILQGSPVYEERDEVAQATINGELCNLYTVTVDGEAKTAYLNTEDNTYYEYDREALSIGEALGTTDDTTATLVYDKVKYIVGYSGVNRVWDADGNAYLDETSTTQGAGSCYTFYPSSPEDQEKSLQLLKHFRISFISSDGIELGSASLNTEKKIEISGKVIVPLEVDASDTIITIKDAQGAEVEVYAIAPLARNEATFITALVYLDGRQLTNDQVLAAGEIQGQLNIQFGTSADLNAMNDPVLQEQKCIVSATMEGATSVAFDDATAADLTKNVTVKVDGYEPQKVEAYFMREINSTQGIRLDKMTFSPTGEGIFTGSYAFTAPGKYILREVILDGVTYELNHEPIVFTVEGFTITSVSCTDNHKSYMLTDKSFDTSVSLKFASHDVTKMPTSVKGAFIHSETKNRTTVYFTHSQGSTWEGSATFTTSGEYVMDYVELDGEYYGLAENQHIKLQLQLGLTARVSAAQKDFDFEPGTTIPVPMTLVIKTDTGDDVKNLEKVWLYYSLNGSMIEEKGSSARMQWNSDKENYTGSFNLDKSGIYNFWYVAITMGDETSYLTTAAASPTLTVVPPDPPTYVSMAGFGEVFSLGNDAAFTINMQYANAATVDAVLKNSDGEVYYSRGVMNDIDGTNQIFTFTVPVIDGKQSGTWTLEGINLVGAYDKNQILWQAPTENGPDVATEGKPLHTVAEGYYDAWWKWSKSDLKISGDATITVVSNVNVSFTNSDLNANKEFGKTNGTVDGLFGEAYTLGNLEISVTTGSEGKPLSDYGLKVDSITLNYQYNTTESLESVNNETYKNKYGNYTVAQGDFKNLIEGDAGKKVYSLASSDGSKYTLAPAASNNTLNVAGSYKATSMVVTIVSEDGTGEELVVNVPVANAPVYKVWSKAPTATITGVSGSPSKQEKITWTQANNCSSNAPDFAVATDNNSATAGVDSANNKAVLYGDATADNSTQHNGSFAQPTLTVTIAGISKDSTASFILPANGNAGAITFSRTGDGAISNKIGATGQIKSWTTSLILTHRLYAYYGHGTQNIDQLTVTQNGITFTFTLENPMKIVNPSSVNQTS